MNKTSYIYTWYVLGWPAADPSIAPSNLRNTKPDMNLRGQILTRLRVKCKTIK